MHTSALVHWPILHNIILSQCTCIFCACTVYTRREFVPEQKLETIFNLGPCSWKLKQLIMKVVVDYAVGSISHHYIMSEALNSFWQLCYIWYASITYNSVAMEVDRYFGVNGHSWLFFSGDLSHRSIQVYMCYPYLFANLFWGSGGFFSVNNNVSKKPCKFSGLQKKSPLVFRGFLVQPFNRKIKIWILISCPYSFPTEVMGRSW